MLSTFKNPTKIGSSLIKFFIIIAMLFVHAATTDFAMAKEKKAKKSLFQILFGVPEKKVKKSSRVRRKRRRTKKVRGPAPIKKIENSKKILVVGDFLASGLAEGLTKTFQQSAGFSVVKKTSGSSGLVRQDYFNWPKNISKSIEKFQPTVVVFIAGSNDRQKLNINGVSRSVMSEEWVQEYKNRIKTIILKVKEANLPFIWVGLPPFSKSTMSNDFLEFNELYKSVVSEEKGEFVDVWDGFVNQEGKFIFTGSDIKGQQVRLRASDGINFTRAGKRKLAFYVESTLKRLLGIGRSATYYLPNYRNDSAEKVKEQKPKIIERTPLIGFSDPFFDGGDILLGANFNKPEEPDKKRLNLIKEGKIGASPRGRADDFSAFKKQ